MNLKIILTYNKIFCEKESNEGLVYLIKMFKLKKRKAKNLSLKIERKKAKLKIGSKFLFKMKEKH